MTWPYPGGIGCPIWWWRGSCCICIWWGIPPIWIKQCQNTKLNQSVDFLPYIESIFKAYFPTELGNAWGWFHKNIHVQSADQILLAVAAGFSVCSVLHFFGLSGKAAEFVASYGFHLIHLAGVAYRENSTVYTTCLWNSTHEWSVSIYTYNTYSTNALLSVFAFINDLDKAEIKCIFNNLPMGRIFIITFSIIKI